MQEQLLFIVVEYVPIVWREGEREGEGEGGREGGRERGREREGEGGRGREREGGREREEGLQLMNGVVFVIIMYCQWNSTYCTVGFN